MNYIDSNICHGISLKNPSDNVGTRTCIAGIRSQQKCYIPSTMDYLNTRTSTLPCAIKIPDDAFPLQKKQLKLK